MYSPSKWVLSRCKGLCRCLILTTHPLSVLVGADQQLYDAWDCSVLSQRGVVGWTQRQVADQSNDGFDERPPAGRVEQLHKHGQSVVKAHSILGHLCLRVATREMAQGTNLSHIIITIIHIIITYYFSIVTKKDLSTCHLDG